MEENNKKHFNLKDRTGEKFITKQGYEIEIVEYISNNNCTIKFNDERGSIRYNVAIKEIKNGAVTNYYHRSKYDVGYIGEGNYCSSKDNVNQRDYDYWDGIYKRCYNINVHNHHPNYINCSVAEEWHNFQNFGKWFEDNFNFDYMQNWCLDKDILVKGNKIYSPETCCFVPNEINVVLTSSKAKRGELPIGVHRSKSGKYKSQIKSNGVVKYLGVFDTPEEAFEAYKTAKEIYLKELANKWKDKISLKVYYALYNYQIEITD
jgi:hypothetical protein